MGEFFFKPQINEKTKIRILPHPNAYKTVFPKLLMNTINLNIGDYVRINNNYYTHNYYNYDNITYKILGFTIEFSSIYVNIDKPVLNIHGEKVDSINIKYLEKDINYYRKQKIKSLLNNK